MTASSFGGFVEEASLAVRGRPENWVFLRRPDSTHRVARLLIQELAAEDELPQPTGFVAREQTAGRGRRGRTWASPPGGVYLTLVAPAVDEADLLLLPIRTAVEAVAAVQSLLGGARCTVKWPNDLVVDGAKVGGILLESRKQDDGFLVIASCGLNVESTPRVDHRAVTSIREEGGSASWHQALAALVERFAAAIAPGPAGGGRRWIDDYRSVSAHRPGEPLSCLSGEEVVEGRFAGFDDRGFLRLETAAGERLLSAAEVLE